MSYTIHMFLSYFLSSIVHLRHFTLIYLHNQLYSNHKLTKTNLLVIAMEISNLFYISTHLFLEIFLAHTLCFCYKQVYF